MAGGNQSNYDPPCWGERCNREPVVVTEYGFGQLGACRAHIGQLVAFTMELSDDASPNPAVTLTAYWRRDGA